jgi:organic radical activating enzyme/TusA-related sulfurtransferase
MKADIDLDIRRKTFATGLLPELIAVLRRARPGEMVAVIANDEGIGPELETWCRFTGNSLLESTVEKGRARWVFRCGSLITRAEDNRPIGTRLWLYTNFDCNLRCDYCCVRSSPTAPRRELGLKRVQRIAREATELGVKEIFVTGGEPFLLEDIDEILIACAAAAPTTVLTNGMLFTGAAQRAWVLCPVIGSSCKSVWTVRHQKDTTSIADSEHGREHVKVFNMPLHKVFECDWQQPFLPIRRLMSSVDFSTKRRLRKTTESFAESLYVVLQLKESLLLELICYQKSRLLPKVCTGIRSERKMPI